LAAELKRLAIAHRAGNDLATLRAAEALGVDLIEADVHLYRGRLEVRHLKTAGPIPILWDRWTLANPFAPRLLLDDLLAAHRGSTPELMLDLKGNDPRLTGRIVEATSRHLGSQIITVCSRNWRLLEPLEAMRGMRVVYSIGSRRQLRTFLRAFPAECLVDGVSIRTNLLTAPIVKELAARASLVMTWGVSGHDQMDVVRAWGVHGLIAAEPAMLDRFVAGAPHRDLVQ
jgi:glycerophosphoryl diester phosphodiesterase